MNLQGLAGVKTVRANSMFGFSLLTVIFDDKIDNYFARTRVLERLNYLGDLLPAGRRAASSAPTPPASAGFINTTSTSIPRSRRAAATISGELRAVQDWFVRYQLNAVPGVAEVASIGGFVRQYQIEVSSPKMRAARRVAAGGDGRRRAEQSQRRRQGHRGKRHGVRRARHRPGRRPSPISSRSCSREREGTPIYLRDVATVQIGGDFRRGALDVNGREVVGGIVVMRTGENAARRHRSA